MNELNLTTPSLLFSAISLILLAYTNRFLSYASVVRSLNEKYQENPDKDPTTLNQIRNFVLRLRLIRAMQTLGAGSLILCLAAMFFYFINIQTAAHIFFGIGMVMLASSLGLCIWEVQISTEAISLHLQNIRRRQREQDPFMGNALRRNANRREGESLGEQNTRKNQEKQRKEKLEREERKAKERQQQLEESTKTNTSSRERNDERKGDNKPESNKKVSNQQQKTEANNKKQERREQPTKPSQVKDAKDVRTPANKEEEKEQRSPLKAETEAQTNNNTPQRKNDTARRYNNRNTFETKEQRRGQEADEKQPTKQVVINEPAPSSPQMPQVAVAPASTQEKPRQEEVRAEGIQQTIVFAEKSASLEPKPKSERKIFANRKVKENQAPTEEAPKPLSRYQQRQLSLKQQGQSEQA